MWDFVQSFPGGIWGALIVISQHPTRRGTIFIFRIKFLSYRGRGSPAGQRMNDFCPAKLPMPRKRLVMARLESFDGRQPWRFTHKTHVNSRQTPDSQELGTASRRRPLFAALIPLVTPEI